MSGTVQPVEVGQQRVLGMSDQEDHSIIGTSVRGPVSLDHNHRVVGHALCRETIVLELGVVIHTSSQYP